MEKNNIENDNKNIFKFDLISKINNISQIKKALELSHDTIGILNEIRYDVCLFLIYSSKTFTMVKHFDHHFKDAVKTEDDNLVLCDNHYIYLYKLINNEYVLLQKIECFAEEKKVYDFYWNEDDIIPNDSIKFIFPLKNNNLIVCSHNEMKIYKNENEQYSYSKTRDMKYYFQEIIEIKPNIIVVYLTKRLGSGCVIRGFNHYISIYNLHNDENKILGQNKSYIRGDDRNKTKNLIIIDKYLIARYGDNLDIYDIEDNMKLINENDYEIKKTMVGEAKVLKCEMPFRYFKMVLKNNFILTINSGNSKSFIYKYENKSIKECEEFPFNLDDVGIIKLKNDKLLLYFRNQIIILNVFYLK